MSQAPTASTARIFDGYAENSVTPPSARLRRRASMRGVLMMVAGGAFYTLNDAGMKLALGETSYGWAIFARGSACCLILLTIGLLRHDYRIKPNNWRGQIECGLYYVIASLFFICSLPFLSFPVAVTALYTSPLFILLLAPLLLGERLTSTRIVVALVGFLGVALAASPGTLHASWMIVFPICSALATAMRDIALRKLVSKDSSISILFFQQACLTLFGFIFFAAAPSTETFTTTGPTTHAIVVACSIGLLLGVYCTIEAFRVADISAISALRYLSIVWAALVGAVVWHDRFTSVQIVGMLLVICSGAAISFIEGRPKAVV